MVDKLIIHKKEIAKNFSRAAKYYDIHAKFQRICGNKLCSFIKNPVKGLKILDAGCGTGWFSRHWKNKGNEVIALDLSYSMLDYARKKESACIYITGDIEYLPLVKESVDVVFSNLAVQWCKSLPRALSELYRVLRPGGTLLISTLANGSLIELEKTWRVLDNNTHINKFLSDMSISAAFSSYRHYLVFKSYCLYYQKLLDLLREIKGVGANYLYYRKLSGLISRNQFKILEEYWPQDKNGLSLSYRIVYGVIYRD